MPVYPVAAGHQDYSGLLIPEIWSPRILEKFYEYTVFNEIANTDYEGEISAYGDTVHIRLRPDFKTRRYHKGQALEVEVPEQGMVDLLIDQGWYWNFLVEKVDEAQANVKYMEEWTTGAGENLKEEIDADIIQQIYVDADTNNQGNNAGRIGNYDMGSTGTPRAVTKANILDAIVDMGTVLDEQKVPIADRWLVLPPQICGLIKKSDLKDASLAGDGTSILRNGRIGGIDRFMIYMSNQLAVESGGAYNVIFGHKVAVTFAAQLSESDVIKTEKTFGRLARGLVVYGYNVNKPDAMGRAVLTAS